MFETRVVHSDPDILGSTPVLVGTRVPVKSLYDYLEAGDLLDEFLQSFPSVHPRTGRCGARTGALNDRSSCDCWSMSVPRRAEVEILVIDDEVTGEERAELHASLDCALEDSDAGRWMEACEYLQRYRANRQDRSAR